MTFHILSPFDRTDPHVKRKRKKPGSVFILLKLLFNEPSTILLRMPQKRKLMSHLSAFLAKEEIHADPAVQKVFAPFGRPCGDSYDGSRVQLRKLC